MKRDKKAVFFDRDGTLIEDRHYLKDPDGVTLLAGAAECVRALREAGFLIVVVSNQSGVARGMMTEDDVRRVNERFCALMREAGAPVDGAYYCPHLPGGCVPAYAADCACRKPKTGMAEAAAHDLGIDLCASYAVGDKAADMLFGANAGMKAGFLVLTGYGKTERGKIAGMPFAEEAASLAEVAEKIAEREARRG